VWSISVPSIGASVFFPGKAWLFGFFPTRGSFAAISAPAPSAPAPLSGGLFLKMPTWTRPVLDTQTRFLDTSGIDSIRGFYVRLSEDDEN
jgi:hypothetical protein